MPKKKRSFSFDDQKAIDVVLDHVHAAGAKATRFSGSASPSRINAANQLLSLLNALPAIEPPKTLVARTMERIDSQTPEHAARRLHASTSAAAHLH